MTGAADFAGDDLDFTAGADGTDDLAGAAWPADATNGVGMHNVRTSEANLMRLTNVIPGALLFSERRDDTQPGGAEQCRVTNFKLKHSLKDERGHSTNF